MATIKITNREIARLLDEEPASFEKYIAPILNLANQFAQGTRPKIVGQMSDIIQQFRGSSMQEWEEWYLKEHPEAIQNATQRILDKVMTLKEAIAKIDRPTVERWVRDLVVVKTYIGLRFQEAILKKISDLLETSYSISSADDEGRGIDGFIGGKAVSIKPDTYKHMKSLPEGIDCRMIYYSKTKEGISVDYGNLLDN